MILRVSPRLLQLLKASKRLISELQQLEKDALAELETCKNRRPVFRIKDKNLGRKGLLTGLLRNIAQVPEAQKPYSETLQ